MKKSLKKTSLKVFLPTIFLLATVGAGVGAYYKVAGNDVRYQAQNALPLGYESKYLHFVSNKIFEKEDYNRSDNLNIITPARTDWDAIVLDDNDGIKNTNPYSYTQHNDSFSVSGPNYSGTVAELNLTHEQLTRNYFTEAKSINFGLLFDVSFSIGSKTLNYTKRLPGFNLNDLFFTKNKSYNIFNYTINDSFDEFTGNIMGYLRINMSKRGVLNIKLDVEVQGFNRTDPSKPAQSLKISFQPQDNQKLLKPILFWNEQAPVNYQNWFWPIPRGPVQHSGVSSPAADSNIIDEGQYSLKLPTTEHVSQMTPKSATDSFSVQNDLLSDAKPWTELFSGELNSLQWQQELFSRWTQPQAQDPGLKINFVFNYSLVDAASGQLHNYQVPLFGYFKASDITVGKKVSQLIANYDLNAGRDANFGQTQIRLTVNTNLQGKILFAVHALNEGVQYDPKNALHDLSNEQKQIKFGVSEVVLEAFNDRGVQTKISDVRPVTSVNFDVRNKNVNARFRGIHFDESRRQFIRSNQSVDRQDPFRVLYHPQSANHGFLDISSLVEHNKGYVDISKLTFHFSGFSDHRNYIQPTSKIVNVTKSFVRTNPAHTPNGANNIYDLTQTQADPVNQFHIKLGAIPKNNEGIYTWKTIYLLRKNDNLKYDKGNMIAKWDGLFDWRNGSQRAFSYWCGLYRCSTVNSMTRVHYKIALTLDQNNPFLIKYRLISEISAFSWRRNSSNEAGLSNISFNLDNITWDLDYNEVKQVNERLEAQAKAGVKRS